MKSPHLSPSGARSPVVDPNLPTDQDVPQTVPWAAFQPGAAEITPVAVTNGTPDLRPGDRVLGFTLLEQLGQGTFARVFLAEQEALAGRQVVLKVTTEPTVEPDRLGRLQHPNVVPVHSVHRAGRYELICMPYLGRTTLADLLRTERARRDPSHPTRPALPDSAHRAEVPTHTVFSTPTLALSVPNTPPAPPLNDPRWVLTRLGDLAAGLAHAHARGILHLDVKPANVLLADSGEPMLLDFNLAHDTTAAAREPVGGTVPYTAPEQLAEMTGRTDALGPPVDARADLYALGAVGYELLTAEQAFPTGLLSRRELGVYLTARQKVPSARARNPAVSPAVDAILRKLMAFDPADRYQTADELKADIDRHLADRPLQSAPDRDVVERLGKWRRRNPWVAARLLVAAALGLGLAFGHAVYQNRHAAGAQAASAQAHELAARLPTLRLDLTAPGDSPSRARGIADAERLLAAFALPDDDRWRDGPAFARLPDDQKPTAAADLGELLLLLAHARAQAAPGASEAERGALVGAVLRLNRRAEGCFAAGEAPPFLFAQRAQLEGEPAPGGESTTARDHYLDAVGLLAGRNLRAAAGSLERATAADPGHAAAHFALAHCRHQLGEYDRALERYDTARALLPDDPRPPFNRGVVYGLKGQHDRAEAEFDLAARLAPGHGPVYRNRAIARFVQGNRAGAEDDLTAALRLGAPPLQVYPFRAQLRSLRDDHRGAEDDLTAVRTYEPKTETDFLDRGRTRLPADPDGALADFEAAGRLNPTSLDALQNQAHVHSDHKKNDARALELVTRAAELYPEYAPARAGRAVLLARLGRRAEAHAEAEAALPLSSAPFVRYQLAGVYARTSTLKGLDKGERTADRTRAIVLLRRAVQNGFRDAHALATDHDLDPVRDHPAFAPLASALTDLAR